MPHKDPAERREYHKKYRRSYGKKKHVRAKVSERNKKYYAKNRGRLLAYNKERNVRTKDEIVREYGGACRCCGESRREFLSIDHINGGGTKRRRIEGGGQVLYHWLRRNGFPKNEYQLLCHNCNMAKGCYGRCPHQEPA